MEKLSYWPTRINTLDDSKNKIVSTTEILIRYNNNNKKKKTGSYTNEVKTKYITMSRSPFQRVQRSFPSRDDPSLSEK